MGTKQLFVCTVGFPLDRVHKTIQKGYSNNVNENYRRQRNAVADFQADRSYMKMTASTNWTVSLIRQPFNYRCYNQRRNCFEYKIKDLRSITDNVYLIKKVWQCLNASL